MISEGVSEGINKRERYAYRGKIGNLGFGV
jgi:hypothetical protein